MAKVTFKIESRGKLWIGRYVNGSTYSCVGLTKSEAKKLYTFLKKEKYGQP